MTKDAFYFSHDSNAKDDPKCMLLIDQLGLEGYGIFWILIETLRDQPNYSYPVRLVPILARRYNTTAEKMLAVVKGYNFFEFDENENFFSLSLNHRMEKLEANREQRRQAGIRSGERRKAISEAKKMNDRSTTVQRSPNENEQSKVKYSKENINNINQKKFYENESAKILIPCKDSENYRFFIDYIFGQNPTKEPLENLLKIPKQLTFEQFKNLLDKKPKNFELLKNILTLENTEKYTKGKKSLYLTMNTWINNFENFKK